MPEVNQYVRFQKNPPEKKPPPKGQVDIYFDPTSGELVKQTADGTETEVGSGGSGDLLAANNLSDLDSAATARTNLGLGAAPVDTSEGGNGAADAGKAVVFTSIGDIHTTGGFQFHDGSGSTAVLAVRSGDNGLKYMPTGGGTLAKAAADDGAIVLSDIGDAGDAAALDTSTGGNGSADDGKAVSFDAAGGVTATNQLQVVDASGLAEGITLSAEDGGLSILFSYDSGNDEEGSLGTRVLTAVQGWYLPNGSGTIAVTSQDDGSITAADISDSTASGRELLTAADASAQLAALGIPTYADLTAANAALNSGDIYFDTALGVLRAAIA